MEKGWQRVYVHNQIHKVEIVRAVLADLEIESFVVDKRDSSYVGIGDIELYVQDKDVSTARRTIEENQL